MKLQIDTEKKTIKIESDIKLSLLIKTLKAMLPNDWKDFTLQTNTTIQHWTNPIIWGGYPYTPYIQPWYSINGNVSGNSLGTHGDSITTFSKTIGNSSNLLSMQNCNSTSSCELKSGVFNVEI